MDFDEISRQCEKMSLSDKDGPVARINDDLQAMGREKLSMSLLGKLIAHKEVNREAFRATIASIWRTTKEVEEIDTGDYGDCVGKFIRVRVLVDVEVPLKRGLRIDLGDTGGLSSVLICYERLPNFCYYCGKIGHLIRECPSYDKDLIDTSNLKFGP
ncbi:hypothetical protein ACOSQ3_007026 [Xanthoceras sorbifolium]